MLSAHAGLITAEPEIVFNQAIEPLGLCEELEKRFTAGEKPNQDVFRYSREQIAVSAGDLNYNITTTFNAIAEIDAAVAEYLDEKPQPANPDYPQNVLAPPGPS